MKEKLSEEKLNSNYAIFIEKLNSLGVNTELLISYLGEDNIRKASYSTNSEYGMAYDGSLIYYCLYKISKYAVLINSNLPNTIKVDQNSLIKVCLLHQISKVQMFEENNNFYEVNNRGILYKFAKLDGALRCGERSIYICSVCGITFTPQEYEAMRIIDKDASDTYTSTFSSTLSLIVKMANELTNNEARILNEKN